MTTPPKVRRYHASASESVRPATADLGEQAAPDGDIRITVRKRATGPDTPSQDVERERLMRTDPVDDGLSHVPPYRQQGRPTAIWTRSLP